MTSRPKYFVSQIKRTQESLSSNPLLKDADGILNEDSSNDDVTIWYKAEIEPCLDSPGLLELGKQHSLTLNHLYSYNTQELDPYAT